MMDSRVIKCDGGTRVSGSHDLSWRVVLAPAVGLLAGCNGAPSRNILGSYFVVMLSIACATTFALWLIWLA
jgi:hypothetical protein